MNLTERRRLAAEAVKNGNWIIRRDADGKSYRGFRWNKPGEWTEAPDWNPEFICGGGLHGQDKHYGGASENYGNRLLFCETDGPHIPISYDKVKVRRARILLVNELPRNIQAQELYIRNCPKLNVLPDNLQVHELSIRDCHKLKSLPSNIKAQILRIYMCYGLETLSDNLQTQNLDIRFCYRLKSLPDNLKVTQLHIRDCPRLNMLPYYIQVQKLFIWDCPGLMLPANLQAENIFIDGEEAGTWKVKYESI